MFLVTVMLLNNSGCNVRYSYNHIYSVPGFTRGKTRRIARGVMPLKKHTHTHTIIILLGTLSGPELY